MRIPMLVFVSALALHAADANACGVCAEDRAAVVYDHAVVERAVERGQHVAFFAIDGLGPLGNDGSRRFARLAESAGGVAKGSARVSRDPVSLLVAFDPRRVSLTALQADLQRRFTAQKVSLRFLQVLDPAAASAPKHTAP